jgi:hypothetical protein
LNDHFPRLTGNTESLPLFHPLSALAYGPGSVQWSQVNAASERNYAATIHFSNRVYVWGRLPNPTLCARVLAALSGHSRFLQSSALDKESHFPDEGLFFAVKSLDAVARLCGITAPRDS